jgi:hypothetical protein
MTYDAVAKSDVVREVGLREWGKVVLEELLLLAASQVSAHGAAGSRVAVTLTFDLTANPADHCLEISTPGVVEQAIVTRLPLPV